MLTGEEYNMKTKIVHSWFTLVEVIVSVTIFGIIMVSVVSIFLFSSQMSQRVELNRLMQENIKSVVEDIAEEVRKGNLVDVSADSLHDCSTSFTSSDTWNKLCLEWPINYMLGYRNPSWQWVRVDNPSDCSNYFKPSLGIDKVENDDTICRVIKNVGAGDYYPLTNSFVAVEKLSFVLTNEKLPKVSIFMTLRPAYKKWLKSEIIDANRIEIQTTVTERLIETD